MLDPNDPEINKEIDKFITAMLAAGEARDNAKWSDEHRRMRHARLHDVIIKELAQEDEAP